MKDIWMGGCGILQRDGYKLLNPFERPEHLHVLFLIYSPISSSTLSPRRSIVCPLNSQYFCSKKTRSKLSDTAARPSFAGFATIPEGSCAMAKEETTS